MISIDLDSPVPLEEQLRRGLREAIARGELAAGDPLPSVRQLAGDLGIHWNTVARAYRRLRDEGLLAVGRGKGVSVVATQQPNPSRKNPGARRTIREKLREVLTEARLSGLPFPEVKKILEQETERWIKEVKS